MANSTLRSTLRSLCHRGRPLRLPLAALACAGTLLALPAAAGELYSWTDANGVTHYSDSPPAGQDYDRRTISASSGAVAAEAPADSEPAETAVSSQCKTARANLKLLQGEGPIGLDSNKDGKPDGELGAEQRAAQTTLAQAAIKVHCAAGTAAGSTADAATDSTR